MKKIYQPLVSVNPVVIHKREAKAGENSYTIGLQEICLLILNVKYVKSRAVMGQELLIWDVVGAKGIKRNNV